MKDYFRRECGEKDINERSKYDIMI